MPIIQINLWTCEICGKTYVTHEKTEPFSDPVVSYPTKEVWEYVGDEKLACPDCVKKAKKK